MSHEPTLHVQLELPFLDQLVMKRKNQAHRDAIAAVVNGKNSSFRGHLVMWSDACCTVGKSTMAGIGVAYRSLGPSPEWVEEAACVRGTHATRGAGAFELLAIAVALQFAANMVKEGSPFPVVTVLTDNQSCCGIPERDPRLITGKSAAPLKMLIQRGLELNSMGIRVHHIGWKDTRTLETSVLTSCQGRLRGSSQRCFVHWKMGAKAVRSRS